MQTSRSRIAFLTRKPARALTCAALAVAFTTAPVVLPSSAFAVSAETQTQLTETQEQVEKATATYEEAQEKLEGLQALIDQNTEDIAEIEAQLPGQRDKAAEAMRVQYKYHKNTNTLLSVVLGTSSINDAISTAAYLEEIQESNNAEIERLDEMEAELETKRVELEQAKTQAKAEEKKAKDALAQAQRLRTEAQEKAEREAAEELARLAAAAKDDSDGDAGQADQIVTDSVTSGAVNWNVTREEFVSEWTARIDAYLAGSPLAGYGSTFANAAWDNGVDPRWSPAISCIESTKGTYCFRDYNAWGWMTSTQFSSWEESITAHVAFLGSCYGPTLTPSLAQKYCPPTWQEWYSNVAGQMNII